MSVIREESSNSKVVNLFSPNKIEATQNDINPIDVSGFDSVLFAAMIGASDVALGEHNQIYLELQHSDSVDNDAVFSPCADSDITCAVIGADIKGQRVTGTFANIYEAIPKGGMSFTTSYIGTKRYVRLVIRCVGKGHGGKEHHGTTICVAAIFHGAKYLPLEAA